MKERHGTRIERVRAGGSGAIPFFDAVAEQYLGVYTEDSLYGYVMRTRRARVLDLLGRVTGRVLDVGCGPGAMTREILEAGCEFWGVDGSPRMIAEGRRRFGSVVRAHFAVADAAALPFSDSMFDGALCVGVIDRVPQPEAVIAELGRVLKPGAPLVIAFPNLLSPYALWRSHVFYAGIGYARRLQARLSRRPPRLDLCSAARLWTSRQARRIVEMRVGAVLEFAYYHFSIFLAPLDELMPAAALETARRLERLQDTRLRWLGAGFLVKAAKASE